MSDHRSGPPNDASPNDVPLSLRAKWIAPLLALSILPITYFAILRYPAPGGASVWISITLITFAVLASALTSKFVNWSDLPPGIGPPAGARLGTRIGSIVFLVGSGMVILAINIHVAVLRTHDLPIPSTLAPWTPILVIVLSACPTIAAAGISALIVAKEKSLPLTLPYATTPKPATNKPARVTGHRTMWAFLTFGVCILTTFFTPLFKPPAPQLTTDRPLVDAEPIAVETPQDEPVRKESISEVRFEYTPPEEMLTADPSQWIYKDPFQLPEMDPYGPVVFSHDGKYLAFRSRVDGSLVIFDLIHRELASRRTKLPGFTGLAWSPDSKRLFLACDDATDPYQILDANSNQHFVLPVRDQLLASKPYPIWWSEDQVSLLSPQERESLNLNLKTLVVEPTGVTQKNIEEAFPGSTIGDLNHLRRLPQTDNAKIAVVPRIMAVSWKHSDQTNGPQLAIRDDFAVVNKENLQIVRSSGISLRPDDHFVCSPDGTIIVQIGIEGTVAHYLALRPKKDIWLGVKLPSTIHESLAAAPEGLEHTLQLAVILYSPLINPLNSQPVGPDRQKVLGIARVVIEDGKTDALELIDNYGGRFENAIASDLHWWKQFKPVFLTNEQLNGWWEYTRILDEGSPTSPSESISRWQEKTLVTTTAGLQADSASPFSSGQVHQATCSPLDLLGSNSKSASVPKENGVNANSPLATQLDDFVRYHHHKASVKDLEGYLSDYHSKVDYYTHGTVSRDAIRKDQAEYFPKYRSIAEAVVGMVQYQNRSDGDIDLGYPIRVDAVRLDGSVSSKLIDVAMTVRIVKNRPLIVSEKSKLIRDLK